MTFHVDDDGFGSRLRRALITSFALMLLYILPTVLITRYATPSRVGYTASRT
jgi:hypothetical protein